MRLLLLLIPTVLFAQDKLTIDDRIALLNAKVGALEAQLAAQQALSQHCQQLYQTALNLAAAPTGQIAQQKQQALDALKAEKAKKCQSGKLKDTLTCSEKP
jgi:cation transport regulator ChaB